MPTSLKKAIIKPMLKKLGLELRLPIKDKIHFKILVLAWKAYNVIGPKYLSDFLDKKNTTHNTCSADTNLLTIPATKLVTWGDRAFKKQHQLSRMTYLPIPIILKPWHLLKPNLKLIYLLNTIKRNYTNITVSVSIL